MPAYRCQIPLPRLMHGCAPRPTVVMTAVLVLKFRLAFQLSTIPTSARRAASSTSVFTHVRSEAPSTVADFIARTIFLAACDNDNDNDNDTLREVPHLSDEGLALQARASGPWPHEKKSVLQVKLALLARCKINLLWTE